MALLPQMILPYALDVVAHEPGGVVADSHRQIPHILGDIVDAVRNNLSVGECGEVVVKGPECTIGQGFSVTLEVPQHLLLLRVNADDGKPNGFRLLADGRDASELFVPVLDLLQGEVLIEGTLPKSKRIKNLADVVTGYIITGLRQFIHNLGNGQGYSDHILVLRKPGRMRLNNLHNSLLPFRMLRKEHACVPPPVCGRAPLPDPLRGEVP